MGLCRYNRTHIICITKLLGWNLVEEYAIRLQQEGL